MKLWIEFLADYTEKEAFEGIKSFERNKPENRFYPTISDIIRGADAYREAEKAKELEAKFRNREIKRIGGTSAKNIAMGEK